MAQIEYIIAGDSHIVPMGVPAPYKGPLDIIRAPDGAGGLLVEPWIPGGRSSGYWDRLVDVCAGPDVLLVYGGNQHYSAFMFAPEPLFDFHDPRTPDIADGARLIPRRLIEAYFEPSLDHLRRILTRLLTAGCRAIRLVGTPPPKSDIHLFAALIRKHFGAAIEKARGIDRALAKIMPASVLLKMWRVIQELMARTAMDKRVMFVPVPPEALDVNGFLAKEFYDYTQFQITHANARFGQLMTRCALHTLTT